MDNEQRAGILTRVLLSAGMLAPGWNITGVKATIVAMLEACDSVANNRGT